jgi:hypothetical protein
MFTVVKIPQPISTRDRELFSPATTALRACQIVIELASGATLFASGVAGLCEGFLFAQLWDCAPDMDKIVRTAMAAKFFAGSFT